MRRFTENETELIRREFVNYVPVAQIAKLVDHSVGTVRQKIFHLGLARNSSVTYAMRHAPPHLLARRAEMTEDAFVAAVKLWRSERNMRSAAERKARIDAAISDIAAGDGPRNVKMRSMRNAGARLQEIGDVYGITRERVRQLIDPRYSPRKGEGKPPIGTIMRLWNNMTPMHRAAFLDAIGARIVDFEQDDRVHWMNLM